MLYTLFGLSWVRLPAGAFNELLKEGQQLRTFQILQICLRQLPAL